jgi:proline iminopeptidase
MFNGRKRTVLWILAAAAVGLALAAAGAWYWIGRPLYTPGDARRQVEAHPQPAVDGSWTVAPGLRLHHFESGRGADVVVLHGGPGIPFRESMPGLRPLEARYLFHYYDQRGCGRSSRPFDRFPSRSFFANLQQLEPTLGLAAQVGDVERVRRILGRERVVLVGHSFGAFLAALYAAEFPERVRGLVLVAPAAVLRLPSADGGLYAEVERVLPAHQLAAYREVVRQLFDFGRLFERSEADLVALHARFVPFYIEAARARGFRVPDAGAAEGGGFMVEAQYLSMGRRHDFRPALARITAPTLVIHGDRDLQSLEESAAYSSGIRGARLERFAASGHFPFVDEPERFSEVTGAFLDALGSE